MPRKIVRSDRLCKWIMYPDKPCDKFALVDKQYCALHKKFEEVYSPDELDTLEWCKKCKQRARPEDYTVFFRVFRVFLRVVLRDLRDLRGLRVFFVFLTEREECRVNDVQRSLHFS